MNEYDELMDASTPVFEVGKELDSHCSPCSGTHGHVVVALVADRRPKLMCRSCGAVHAYRQPEAEQSDTGPIGDLSRHQRVG